MKVFILCGGYGTRLREFTEVMPKPMVEIGGRPILWHIMKHYSSQGFSKFVLCIGYKGNVIREFFLNHRAMTQDFTIELGPKPDIQYHGNSSGEEVWNVTLADTGISTMTGARIQVATDRYLGDDETFAVTYGDGLTDVNLRRVLEFHRGHGGMATLLGVHPRSRYGEISHDLGKVISFNEKPKTGSSLINGGFFFFQKSFLRYLNDDAQCILERGPLTRCAADGELHVFEHHGFWHAMDTYRDWNHLQSLWEEGRAPWKTW